MEHREVLMNDQQFQKVKSGSGFIAALDQSGGSTPKALQLYGIGEDAYSGDDEMFALVHAFRSRIITSPGFGGDRILGAILFEDTMDRTIAGRESAQYLWGVKGVVPFLKVDKGLAPEADGAQILKPISGLDALLARAKGKGIFGTKMRSFITRANPAGVKAVVDQQFTVARQILAAGLVPIVEPEIDIHSPEKSAAEALLKVALLAGLGSLGADDYVMLKLTLPDADDFYAELVRHPRVLRVVALSGGYSRDEANARLARNHGVIASFSRALTDGLKVDQTDEEFDAILDTTIASIFEASKT
jgi:fructose-bisphosphate aldolase, class I